MPRVEPRQRNARGQGGRLRSEIVEASRRLIDDGGDALTLRAIAREAGIVGPSIYDHFANVDEIRDDVVRLCFDELIARFSDADKAATDPESRLQDDDAVAVWACIHGLTTLRASRPDFRQVQSDETLRDIVRRQGRIVYD